MAPKMDEESFLQSHIVEFSVWLNTGKIPGYWNDYGRLFDQFNRGYTYLAGKLVGPGYCKAKQHLVPKSFAFIDFDGYGRRYRDKIVPLYIPQIRGLMILRAGQMTDLAGLDLSDITDRFQTIKKWDMMSVNPSDITMEDLVRRCMKGYIDPHKKVSPARRNELWQTFPR
jgi:hypothetical protein